MRMAFSRYFLYHVVGSPLDKLFPEQQESIHFVQVLEDIEIPDVLRDTFISIPADKFRMDISSTEIRKRCGQ